MKDEKTKTEQNEERDAVIISHMATVEKKRSKEVKSLSRKYRITIARVYQILKDGQR